MDRQQLFLNEALDKVKALEWRDRVVRRLNQKLEPLSSHDKIQLLRQVEELL